MRQFAGQPKSATPRVKQDVAESATSPTWQYGQDDGSITQSPFSNSEVASDSDRAITRGEVKTVWIVGSVAVGVLFAAIPAAVYFGKLDTRVDAVKESGAKVEQKVERLIDDNSSTKSRLGIVEDRINRLEPSVVKGKIQQID
ncbi:MAG: hypothetical protein IPJ28_05030 [Betaproteobacteria bacterium]|nr:hypothetical protein [Betaproteobacteria bacterium]